MTTSPIKNYLDTDGLAYYNSLIKGTYAPISSVPTKLSELNNDKNFVSDANYTHTDNNYTDAEKTKLAGITSGATPNAIEAITVNGVATAISNKTVNITVPTDNKNLSNGAGYQTSDQVESAITSKGYQTSAQVESAISAKGYQTASQVENTITSKGYQTASQVQAAITNANHLKRVIADTLPDTGDDNTIYLVPSTSSSGSNVKDEYMWIDSKWEIIGTSETILSGYIKTEDLTPIGTSEIFEIFSN